MRITKIYMSIIVVFLTLFIGCVGELPEEQFEKYVLLTRNGWVEQDIEFTPTNTVEVPVGISISGTSSNKQNVEVKLKYDPDVLARYNLEKYKLQNELYYSIIPESALSFSNTLTIPSGEEQGVVNISIDFNQITDHYKDYVLPISIDFTSHYTLKELDPASILKHSETLYHIRRVNSFSGDYAGSSTVHQTIKASPPPPGALYQIMSGTEGVPVTSKTLYAISDTECYFYAGQISRSTAGYDTIANMNTRDKFIVNVRVNENDSLIFTSPNPDLTLYTSAAKLVLDGTTKEVGKQSVITTTTKVLTTDARYAMVTKVFDFCYAFYNVTDESPVTTANNHILLVKGSLSRERKELIK